MALSSCDEAPSKEDTGFHLLEQHLTGSWIIRTGPDTSETLFFEPRDRFGTGILTEVQWTAGKLARHQSGTYRFHHNPLLPSGEKVQLVVNLHDAYGDKERTFTIRSLNKQSLTLGGLGMPQTFVYQRNVAE